MTARTRPLCPYPEVARYDGSGSIDDAENFVCVSTVPIPVRIEPETLNLKSNGNFTAFITVPSSKKKNWIPQAVVCEGALATKVTRSANTLIAKFDTQDLINIVPGSAMTFTVTAIDGEYAFEGSDTVKVTSPGAVPSKPPKTVASVRGSNK